MAQKKATTTTSAKTAPAEKTAKKAVAEVAETEKETVKTASEDEPVKKTARKAKTETSRAGTAKKTRTAGTRAKTAKTAKAAEPEAEAAEMLDIEETKTTEPKTEEIRTEEAVTKEPAAKATKGRAPRKTRSTKAAAVKTDETKGVKPEENEDAAAKPKSRAGRKPKTVKKEEPEAVSAGETKADKPEEPKTENIEAPAAAETEKAKNAEPAETIEAAEMMKAAEAAEAAEAEKNVETVKAAETMEAAETEEGAETAETEKNAAEAAETDSAGQAAEEVSEEPGYEVYTSPRRSVAFIGSECYPFVKTGGLGDVMYALPKALVKQNCDVKVILPRYKCIPWKYQEKMIYRGAFQMDLCADGRSFYVGIMEYVWDGVVYDFIDNEEFFGSGNPYTNLVDDIPKYCYFAKAALAALNYMDWIPDIIHCHDWQAALTPVYLRTLFAQTKLSSAQTILTIHNLRFQGIYNIPTIRYWTGLPDYVFNKDALKEGYEDANMLKGGLTYANMITTVSNTYAWEIQTPYYGEKLDAHLRYHAGKLRGIVNGIDYDIWNTATDPLLDENYDITSVLEKKKINKRKLQEELGLVQDDHKFVIGLVSRLTNQKGLDLVNSIIPQIMDEHTQIVVLGTGDAVYEDSFRYYEYAYKGNVCSNIMYDESRAHKIYAGADAFLVPSQFEPCGLTQLIAMHYGTIPIVRETGGLKDTVEPYNAYTNGGNGFTFDRYDAGLLLDAINRAKTLYFTNRWCWDEMVQRDMDKNFSWDNSAGQYKDLYLELTWQKG